MAPEGRALIAATAAGIVVTVAMGLILLFGQLHYPRFDDLAERPDPTVAGIVEFTRWDRDGGCRYEVPAGGGEESLIGCGPAPARPDPRPDPRLREGRRLEPGSIEGAARLWVYGPGDEAELLLEVEGPRDYAFWDAQWSPDGRWILVADSGQRALIVPAAGGSARLLVRDASDPSWRR